jgi:hypothetical protein
VSWGVIGMCRQMSRSARRPGPRPAAYSRTPRSPTQHAAVPELPSSAIVPTVPRPSRSEAIMAAAARMVRSVLTRTIALSSGPTWHFSTCSVEMRSLTRCRPCGSTRHQITGPGAAAVQG